MAATWTLSICAVLAACLMDNVVFCDEQEPQYLVADELQGVSTDPQLVLDLTANFASILQSLTKLEKPQSVVVSPDVQEQEIVDEVLEPESFRRNTPLEARDCNDVAAQYRNISSGLFYLKPHLFPVSQKEKDVKTFAAYCDMETDGGRWTVIQRRQGPLVGFYRGWEEYKNGFGFLDGDHWLGLQRLHLMTVKNKYELRVELEDFEGNQAYAKYDNFQIGDENTNYALMLGAYQGTAKDSLSYHNGKGFTTKDRDNDRHKGSCAQDYKGAWWYGNCHYSNLNGPYVQGTHNNDIGMTWYAWKKRHVSLKRAEMKIRRVDVIYFELHLLHTESCCKMKASTIYAVIATLIINDIQLAAATCQGTECTFDDLQSMSDAQLWQNLTATIAQVLQNQLNIRIVHDYQNCSKTTSSDNVATEQPHLPQDCTEILSNGNSTSGVYKIIPQTPEDLYFTNISQRAVKVYCDMDTDGGGWTLFQRRHNGLVNFYRDWEDYKNGFGYADGDYWLGLQNLHWMTSTARYELRVDLEDFSGNMVYAKYNSFEIAEEKLYFMLILGDYQGTASDSLSRHSYHRFSTKDSDHDTWSGNCPHDRQGAWWYADCASSNLNGLYKGPSQTDKKSMAWHDWKSSWEALKKTGMKIRRVG
ncbi:uncharacterized protein [Amphiura filiformis]|uniref:uncharacterized protein n=1 Tax=Amphiura filiformis TaxID=82378 RepID=UPI003B21585C